MEEVKSGDIVQITNDKHSWYPCLIIVSEVKSWGIQGYITIPANNNACGNAYIRLESKDFEIVGYANILAT
jgi:hypothetical protein